MDERRFERLREQLLAAGVAARHVRRALDELRSHLEAWVADAVARGLARPDAVSEALAALGSDADIVARFAAQPALLAWSARWPALCFLALPAAVFVLIGAALMAGMLAVLQHWPALHHMTVPVEVSKGVNRAAQIGLLGLLPVGVCAWFALLAHRQRLALRWPVVGIFVLCLLASMINVGLDLTGGEHAGSASAGIGTSGDAIGPQMLRALGLGLIVIVPFWLVERRSRRDRMLSR